MTYYESMWLSAEHVQSCFIERESHAWLNPKMGFEILISSKGLKMNFILEPYPLVSNAELFVDFSTPFPHYSKFSCKEKPWHGLDSEWYRKTVNV